LLDDGLLLIQPVCATDIARAALAAVARGAVQSAVYNVAGPDGVTTRRYYEIVAGILGVNLKDLSLPSRLWVAGHPDRAPFAQHRLYDTSALVRGTGYTPSITLESALRETIDALEESGSARPFVAELREAALIERLQTGEADLSALLADL
jgi:nucleoside-diphosphate-sugar epimerase